VADEPLAGVESAEAHRRVVRGRLVRGAAVVVVLVLVIAFVVANAQPVKVRFWFVNAHPKLIWVIVGCLVVGAGIGAVLGRPGRFRGKGSRRRRRRG
jgi:uncharacterized integral membrane protein